jgi:hypothetical protein
MDDTERVLRAVRARTANQDVPAAAPPAAERGGGARPSGMTLLAAETMGGHVHAGAAGVGWPLAPRSPCSPRRWRSSRA